MDRSKGRWCFVGDDSGHDYIILVEQKEEFEAWVASEYHPEFTYSGSDFDEYRVDGGWSFTNPQRG